MPRDRNALSYRALLWWVTLTLTTAWLPMIRGAMDGPAYEWSTSLFRWTLAGHGTAGDYWYVAARSVIGLAILFAAWRRPVPGVRGLVAAYVSIVAADLSWAAATDPAGLRFRGDTLGVDLSLTWVAPLIAWAFAAVAIRWLLHSVRLPQALPTLPWSAGGRRRLVIAVGLLPAQWFLLRLGDGMDWRDTLGVVLTIAQWWLLSAAFASRPAPVRVASRSASAAKNSGE